MLDLILKHCQRFLKTTKILECNMIAMNLVNLGLMLFFNFTHFLQKFYWGLILLFMKTFLSCLLLIRKW